MMDLINRHYRAQLARGTINDLTTLLDFQQKLHEEVSEFDKEVDKFMFAEPNRLAQESIDVISVLFNMLKHFDYNIHHEHETNVITQEKRACIKPEITLKSIEKIIIECTGIPRDAIYMKTRKREIVEARQLICYFGKERNLWTLAKIGEFIGRDHATVLYSHRNILNLIKTNYKIRTLVKDIESRL